MAFSSWDPLRDLLALQDRLDRFDPERTPGWLPPIDVYETADAYVITAELPGLSRDQIDIQAREGRLVLRGVRPSHHTACEQYHRIERGYGPFSRTFSLPEAVAADGIQADLHDGILTITVPKAAAGPARRIPVD
jgi:HSP20 family protein